MPLNEAGSGLASEHQPTPEQDPPREARREIFLPERMKYGRLSVKEETLQRPGTLILSIFFAISCVTLAVSEPTAGNETSASESWQRIDETVIYRSNAPTKVTVIGNSVLVPATLAYQGNQVDVQLLLDTGASGTAINTAIADRLHVDLHTARKVHGRVVGGAVIEGFQVTLSSITVGPHSKENLPVFVIQHNGPAPRYDGLLGLDILRGLKYVVDFDKQLIIWE